MANTDTPTAPAPVAESTGTTIAELDAALRVVEDKVKSLDSIKERLTSVEHLNATHIDILATHGEGIEICKNGLRELAARIQELSVRLNELEMAAPKPDVPAVDSGVKTFEVDVNELAERALGIIRDRFYAATPKPVAAADGARIEDLHNPLA